MDVEVDLYSGRPNPHYTLGSAAASELMRRIAALPPAPGPVQPRDGLGYRGLRITGSGDSSGEIIVSGGMVLVRDPGGSQRPLYDPERALERWLVDAGSENLDPVVVSALREDLPQ